MDSWFFCLLETILEKYNTFSWCIHLGDFEFGTTEILSFSAGSSSVENSKVSIHVWVQDKKKKESLRAARLDRNPGPPLAISLSNCAYCCINLIQVMLRRSGKFEKIKWKCSLYKFSIVKNTLWKGNVMWTITWLLILIVILF